jgi:hypothetical protein
VVGRDGESLPKIPLIPIQEKLASKCKFARVRGEEESHLPKFPLARLQNQNSLHRLSFGIYYATILGTHVRVYKVE